MISDDDRGEQDELGDQAKVGAVRAAQPAVEHLLDGDRHDDPADGGDQRERERDRQPAAELRHQPQAPAQGGQRALGPALGRSSLSVTRPPPPAE